MRHLRILRKLMPQWHSKERAIAENSRGQILKGIELVKLKELDSIKGYREVRYQAAAKYLGSRV